MLFRSKKSFSFICALVLLFLALFYYSVNVSAKLMGDCIFSVGSACRPAQWLRKTHKRFQSSPFDWMMKYSLDTVIHCFRNNFVDFFEDVEATGEIIGNNRVVRDTKNGIVSMHHFSKYDSLESGRKDVRGKMIGRGRKVDKILKNSRSIILICNRQKDSLGDFKRFLHNFSKLYPDRDITLVNIHSNGNNWVSKEVLYTGLAATSEKKNQKVINKNKSEARKQLQTKKQTRTKSEETKVEVPNQSEKQIAVEKKIQLEKSVQTKNPVIVKKRPKKKKRRKLRIIQYSFNDTSSSWEGNPSGWQYVMDDIELTSRNFDKNMDFKQVEF